MSGPTKGDPIAKYIVPCEECGHAIDRRETGGRAKHAECPTEPPSYPYQRVRFREGHALAGVETWGLCGRPPKTQVEMISRPGEIREEAMVYFISSSQVRDDQMPPGQYAAGAAAKVLEWIGRGPEDFMTSTVPPCGFPQPEEEAA